MKRLIGISVFVCALSSFAQDEMKEVFVTQMSRISDETGLKDLPPHLKPEPGKLSLLADFQNQKEGQATIYLVNATKKLTILPIQDGDSYCKRESKGADGQWRRCDSHLYSWCGNSYSRRELPAGSFLSWEQKLDSKNGKPKPVRFRIFSGSFGELASNEGTGRVADDDITFCRYDAMAMDFGPFEDVAAVATGKVKGSQGSSMGGNSGIGSLVRFADEERLFPVLKEVVVSLLKQSDPQGLKPNDNESHFRIMLAAHEYDLCLQALGKTMGRTINPNKAREYVVGQVDDPKFPWGGVALDWLIRHFEGKWPEEKALVEKVLSQPEHKALQSALHAYGKLAEKDEAGPRLEAISKDKRYAEDVRDYARQVRDRLFRNPSP